jgi:hypothetical protein
MSKFKTCTMTLCIRGTYEDELAFTFCREGHASTLSRLALGPISELSDPLMYAAASLLQKLLGILDSVFFGALEVPYESDKTSVPTLDQDQRFFLGTVL